MGYARLKATEAIKESVNSRVECACGMRVWNARACSKRARDRHVENQREMAYRGRGPG